MDQLLLQDQALKLPKRSGLAGIAHADWSHQNSITCQLSDQGAAVPSVEADASYIVLIHDAAGVMLHSSILDIIPTDGPPQCLVVCDISGQRQSILGFQSVAMNQKLTQSYMKEKL